MVKLQIEISDFLDSTRGFAAILVLLAHLNQFFLLPYYGAGGLLQLIAGYIASCAVVLFFLISGFVIALSIQNSRLKHPEQWLFDFFLRRAARIYPPLIFSMILCFGVCIIIYAGNLHGKYSFHLPEDLYTPRESILFEWRKILSTLLMIPGFIKSYSSMSMNGPLWSISYEFWMYALAGLSAYAFTQKNRSVKVFLFSILLFQILQNNQRFIYFALIWLIGFSCFHLKNISITKKVEHLLLSLLFCCFGAIIYMIHTHTNLFIPYRNLNAYLFQFLLITVGVCAAYYFKIWNKSIFKLFKFASSYSYTLYLIHFPLLLISFSLLHQVFMNLGLMKQIIFLSLLAGGIMLISRFVAKGVENVAFFYKLIHSCLNKSSNPHYIKIDYSGTKALTDNLHSKSNLLPD